VGGEKSSRSRLVVLHAADGGECGRRDCVSVDGQDQGSGRYIPRTPCKVQKLRCVRMERLKGTVPVFDVTNVKETHYFFAKSQSGFLVAHNTAVLDELNYMARTRRSKLARFTGDDEYDQAEKLYTTILRRVESRYMNLGRVPGKIFLISSANYEQDFIDRKEREAKTNDRIYVVHMSQWEALPAERFTGGTFYVVMPEDKFKGAVLDELPEEGMSDKVLEVPIEYKDKFERDLLGSLRDLAGIPMARRNRVFEKHHIAESFDAHDQNYEQRQIFVDSSVCLEDLEVLEQQVDLDFLSSIRFQGPFGAHVDLALTNDSAGVGIGHVVGLKDIGTRTVFDPETGQFSKQAYGELPVYGIVGLMRVDPPRGGEIDLNAVRDLLFFISEVIPLKWVTFDRFQSAALIQAFRAKRISSKVLSVDKNPQAYMETKHSLIEGRLWVPRHPVFEAETENLEQDSATGKVNHPAGGSKDVSDAVAGVVFEFSQHKRSYRQTTSVSGTGRGIMTSRATRRSVSRPSSGRDPLY